MVIVNRREMSGVREREMEVFGKEDELSINIKGYNL